MSSIAQAAAAEQFGAVVKQWDEGAWCLAALALATDGGDSPAASAAREVLSAAGLDEIIASAPFTAPQLAGIARSPLLQAEAVAAGRTQSWAALSDQILLSQGEASGSAAQMFSHFLLPQFPDLAARLASPGAQMLDVGTGVGALAIGFAVAFPNLHVTGLDVVDRVLELARGRIEQAGLGERVVVRAQDVATLEDDGIYDLAWIPAPFVPETVFSEGVRRMARALRSGGMLMIGHGRFEGAPLDVALTRFKTLAYGGTALDGASAVALLRSVGFENPFTAPTPTAAPGLTVAIR